MKVRENLKTTTPAHELATFVTPAHKLFVVYHMGVPVVDASTWRVAVTGLVHRPLTLTLPDLEAMPQTEVTAFHECAGSPLNPTVPVRRVGNVVWRGVRLNHILAAAGVRPDAKFVWSRGADSGIYAPTGTHNDSYVKDLPLEKAMSDGVLVATSVNGEPLDEPHGAPVRLVVPGYYGTNSVKWLTEIRLEDARSGGFFTTRLYNDVIIENGERRKRPVWAVAPHALIVSPTAGSVVSHSPHLVWGWAWGDQEISSVELSTDGGESWRPCALERREGYAWQRFSREWTPQRSGTHELACRARDVSGEAQPLDGARNQVFRIAVQVEAGAGTR
jgi:DMSO/TMAO reductase YedYZ molybdopterin-dependent catalytic subunit